MNYKDSRKTQTVGNLVCGIAEGRGLKDGARLVGWLQRILEGRVREGVRGLEVQRAKGTCVLFPCGFHQDQLMELKMD